MKSIVITGSTGLLGTAIIGQAIEAGYDVTAIVRRNSSRISNLQPYKNLKIIECNLDEYASLETTVHGDIFIHLAWDKTYGNSRDDTEVQMKNIQYTLDAVRLAKKMGCSTFLGAGSQAEFGVQTVDLTPDLPVLPESGYGIAKFTAGKLSGILCNQLGLKFNWVRVLSVYGINDAPHTLISYAVTELLTGRSPELTKCEQDWDYLNSKDAARAFLSIAENGTDGKTYVLGSGEGRKLKAYLEELKQIVNPVIELGYGKKDYYPHQPMHLVADISELTKDTGWKPEISFRDGITEIKNMLSVYHKDSTDDKIQ